jgi:hypothetical protein
MRKTSKRRARREEDHKPGTTSKNPKKRCDCVYFAGACEASGQFFLVNI